MSISKLPDKRTSGMVRLSKIRMLIYGAPKIGKTTLVVGFPELILAATEKGYEAHKVYAVDINTWEDFKDFTRLIIKGKHKFKNIGIDTVDRLFRLCKDYVCDELGISHISDEDWGKGYDMAADEFERETDKLFSSSYGLLLTSHTKIQEMSSGYGKLSKVIPTLSNQARRLIIPKVAVIGYMHLKSVKINDKLVEYRVISFKPSEVVEAGDRDGKLPEEVRAYRNSLKTYQEFQKYYKEE